MAKATSKLVKPAAEVASVPVATAEVVAAAMDVGGGESNSNVLLMKVGEFNITIEDVGDLPDAAFGSSTRGVAKLPFPTWFEKMAESATWREVFLPHTFWTSQNKSAAIKLVRNKLNKSFSDWVKKDAEKRKGVEMRLVVRKKGDLNSKKVAYPEDGVSIFVRNPSVAPTPAA